MGDKISEVQLDEETAAGPLSFNELVDLSLKLHSRIDFLWQRVIYSHAAIVTVLAFFATQNQAFVVPRILVFFFYSMNSLVLLAAFRDAYTGLDATISDLRRWSQPPGKVSKWLLSTSYGKHALRRAAFLLCLWVIISYLIFYPLFAHSPIFS